MMDARPNAHREFWEALNEHWYFRDEPPDRFAPYIAFADLAYQLGDSPLRKYTGDPYIVHPLEVATIMLATCIESVTPRMVSAAIMHDVIEDTPVTWEMIEATFADADLADMVLALSDTEYPEGERPNRKTRKAADLARLADSDWNVQTVKVADLMSNTRTIVPFDPDFAVVYLREKRELLDALTECDPVLRAAAYRQLGEADETLTKSQQKKDTQNHV